MRHLRIFICMATLLLISSAASAQQDVINTIAGGGPNNVPATAANLNYPYSVAADSSGNFYIASPNQARVFKVDHTSGTLTVLAGNGFPGYGGDGGPAAKAQIYLGSPSQVAVDSSGNVYFADTNNCVVREVSHATGNISTFAGTPQGCGTAGDGGPATSATLYLPTGVAVDSSGNVFISSYSYDYRIREVTASNGFINTVAGNGTQCTGGGAVCGDGGLASSAEISSVYALATDGAGNVYLSDFNNYQIRKFAVGGNIITVAGNGTSCSGGGAACGDGGLATSAGLYYVYGLAVDSSGKIFIADYYNYSIREVSGGIINTVAGNGNLCNNPTEGPGCSLGDGGLATSAELSYVYGVAVDSSDNMFIADFYNLRIREAVLGGNISTVAGNGTLNFTGNNIPATNAVLNNPRHIALDSAGNIYFADWANQIVRKVDAFTGNITTIAGTPGTIGFTGDSGPATSATLNFPGGVAVDSSGNVYIADSNNNRIRKVDTGGKISTYAGNGNSFDGDGTATQHGLYQPYGVAVDSSGNLYIADTYDYRIRKVDTGGNMTTIGGNGIAGYSGDGGPATGATMNTPVDVAVDVAGDVYFADNSNLRFRKIDTTGTISTIAGNGTSGFQADGVPANETSVSSPWGVAVNAAGDVLIADTYNNRIRWVDGAGIIHTVAGNGNYGFSGDGSAATSAMLAQPAGLTVDPQGNIYIADTANQLIRKVNAVPGLNASPNSVTFGVEPVGISSNSQVVTLAAIGSLTITNILTTGDFSETDDCGSGPASGSTCTVWLYFTPTSSGARTGTLTISDNGFFSTTLTVNLHGTGTALSLTPATIAFGNQVVKTTSATKNVVVKNNGSGGIIIGSGNPYTLTNTTDFAIASNTCPAAGGTLAGKASCTIGITFDPQAKGLKKGALVIKDNDPTSPQLVGLSGTGTGFVTVTPSPLIFTKVQLFNTTSTASKITVKNTGANPVVLASSNAVVASAQFAIASGTTCTNSLSLALNASCIINVTFTPTSIGTVAGTVTITDSDPTSPQVVPLTATATEVNLSPATLAFGTVLSGTKILPVTATNKGTTPLTFGTITVTGTGNAQFSVLPSDGTHSTCLNGSPVSQNGTCTISVQFTSTGAGTTYTETLNVNDNGGASPQTVKITAKD